MQNSSTTPEIHFMPPLVVRRAARGRRRRGGRGHLLRDGLLRVAYRMHCGHRQGRCSSTVPCLLQSYWTCPWAVPHQHRAVPQAAPHQHSANRAPGLKQAREQRQRLPDRHARTPMQVAARSGPATKQASDYTGTTAGARSRAVTHAPARSKPGHGPSAIRGT